jgi:hypothetical protein
VARPTKLNARTQAVICEAIIQGLHKEVACNLAGVTVQTLHQWMRKGDPNTDEHQDEPDLANLDTGDLRKLAALHGITVTSRTNRATIVTKLTEAGAGSRDAYVKFRDAILQAETELERRLVAQVQAGAAPLFDKEGNVTDRGLPRTLLLLLQRRFPERWNPATALEITGKDGEPLEVNVTVEQRIADKLDAFMAGAAEHADVAKERQAAPTK